VTVMAGSNEGTGIAALKAACTNGANDDVDRRAMKLLDAAVRESDQDAGGSALYRKAPLVNHFSYFRPSQVAIYDQLSAKDRREGKCLSILTGRGPGANWSSLA
jgi:hypothetical protein